MKSRLPPNWLASTLMRPLAGALRSFRRRQSDLESRVAALATRIEFVREEVLFELRYGDSNRDSSVAPAGRPQAAARVISSQKLDEARQHGEIRLNLGCGHKPIDRMINVDARELPGVDVVSPVDDLPFEPNSVTEIYSAHLLEHFPQMTLERTLLPYWHGLLEAGGEFHVVVPDWQTMLEQHVGGTYSYEDLRLVTFGAQDYDGDFHYNMFTADSLTRLLEKAGFARVEAIEVARRNGACFEMELVATK